MMVYTQVLGLNVDHYSRCDKQFHYEENNSILCICPTLFYQKRCDSRCFSERIENYVALGLEALKKIRPNDINYEFTELLDKLTKAVRGEMLRYTPRLQAASIVYIACVRHGINITQKTIASLFCLTEFTLRRGYHYLQDDVKIERYLQ
ncbi:MAG: hypothetical protein ACRD5H_18505, partial [Nitrososphaerales archaeon]